MRKFIWISFAFLLILGCGSRKKNLQTGSEKTELKTNISGESNVSINKSSYGEMNLSEFLDNKNLKITSNGSPYQFKYGNLIFSGSADVELSEKKAEKVVKYLYVTQTIYKSQTTYNSKTTYTTEKHFRTVDVERSGISFGNIVWIVLISLVTGAFLWSIIKKYFPIWFKKLMNKI